MPDSTFDKTGLIQQLIQRANRIPYRNKIELDHFRDQVDQTIQNIFGNESDYRHQLNRIRFIPSSFYSPEKEYEESWQRGIQEIIHFLTNILRTESISPNSHKKWIDPGLSRESLIDLSTTKDGNKEFNLPAQRAGTGFQPIDSNEKASKVESYPLIEIPLTNYYSKDEESPLPTEEPPIQSTARQEYQKEKYAYLESFMSEAAPVFSPLPSHKPNDAQETAQIIFLSGEDDQFGKTIQLSLKKLGLGHKLLVLPTDRSPEEILNRLHSDSIQLAIVAFAGEDWGRKKTAPANLNLERAAQSIVLEAGILLGKLGKERVLFIIPDHKNFEPPTAGFAITYTPLDLTGRWQFDLVKILKTFDISIDANKLF